MAFPLSNTILRCIRSWCGERRLRVRWSRRAADTSIRSFVALSWPSENDNATYIDGFTEIAAATPDFQATNTQSASPCTSDEFVHFFNTRRSQALKSLPSTPAQQRDLKTHHYRTTLFSNNSELGKSLEATETENLSPDKRRAVENCRMACLIYLNLIMADYGDFSPPQKPMSSL